MSNLAVVKNLRSDLDDMVVSLVKQFLKENKTKSTGIIYKRNIEEFFDVSIEYLTFDMIAKVSCDQAKKFYNDMIENSNEKSTVSGKASAVRNMYEYLIDNLVEWNGKVYEHILKVNPLNGYDVKYKSKSHEAFTEDEVKAIISLAREEGRLDLSVYYEMLVVTAVRSSSVLKLTMSDIVNVDGKWRIKGEDKGHYSIEKDFDTAIPDYLYEDLKKLADSNDGNKIFTFTRQTCLNNLCGAPGRDYKRSYLYKIGISEEEMKKRNLTLHSFKSTSAVLGVKFAKNSKQLSQHLHHAHTTTSDIYLKSYKEKDEEISLKINVRESNTEDKKAKLEKLSKEELIQIILKNGIEI